MCSIGTRPADTDGPGVTRCPRRGPSTARDASVPLGQQGRAGGRSREARCGAGRARLPFTARGDRRMLQPRGVGGLGLPAGRWPPATPGRLGEHAWRERPWPRNALRDLTRATPLGLVSPTCGRASVTPAFLGRFQGRTAADFSEGPGSKEVWKRRQRSRGDWAGADQVKARSGRARAAASAVAPLDVGISPVGEGPPPTGSPLRATWRAGGAGGDRCHPARVRRLRPPARAPSLSSGPRWSESGESASGTALEATQGLEDLALLKPTCRPGTAGSGRPQVRQEETEACRGAPSVGLPVTRV